MILVFRILSVLFAAVFWVPDVSSQNPAVSCNHLSQQGTNDAFRSDFIRARKAYQDAVECYHSAAVIDSVVENMLLVLDCDKALSEIRLLQHGITGFESYILSNKTAITPRLFVEAQDAAGMFKLYLLDQLGIVDEAIEGYHGHERFVTSQGELIGSDYKKYRLGQIYFEIARLLYRSGNFETALDYIHRSLQTTFNDTVAIKDGLHIPRLILQARIVSKLYRSDELNRIKYNIEGALGHTKYKRGEREFTAYSALADIYLKAHKADSAIIYLSRLQQSGSAHQHRAEILQLTGDYHIATGDFIKAESSYRDAIQHILMHQGAKNEAISTCYLSLGQLYLNNKKFSDALQYLHLGLYSLSEISSPSKQLLENPPLQALYRQRNTLELLRGKATVLFALYQVNHNSVYLDASWRTIRLANHFMDNLRTGYHSESDKSLLVDQSYPVFEQALGLAYYNFSETGESRWIDSAFVLMEESKALNLRDAVLHGQARRFAGIPDSLLQLENSLRLEIAGKERLIQQYQNTPFYQEVTAIAYRNDLANTKTLFRELIARYEREHPEYYALKHKPIAIDLSQIKNALEPGQTMLEYFVGDSSIYLLIVNATQLKLHQIPRDIALAELVTRYRKSLIDFASGKSLQSLTDYTESASHLYKVLIPNDIQLDSALLIIPDGILGYLSFSSLLLSKPADLTDIRTYDYLLWHHDIGYSYSANLYLELNRNANHSGGNALICAPEFDGSTNIPALKYNAQEAKMIRSLTGGRLLSGSDCTSSAFYRSFENEPISILHLATHGSANDESGDASFLVFSQSSTDSAIVYARDLYNIEMPLDLVYLSACETGTGELRRGEGMISLARAFFYAGAQSLITTLWRVEDQRSAMLSQRFYTHLKAGERKDRALSASQRDFIQSLKASEKYYAHPVYWSALIPVGNMQALEMNTSSRFPIWLMALVGLSVAFLLTLLILRMNRYRRNH